MFHAFLFFLLTSILVHTSVSRSADTCVHTQARIISTKEMQSLPFEKDLHGDMEVQEVILSSQR